MAALVVQCEQMRRKGELAQITHLQSINSALYKIYFSLTPPSIFP